MRSFLKNNQIKNIATGYVAVILILGLCFIAAENNIAQAQSSTNIDDISQKIKERTDAIQKLDAEKKISRKNFIQHDISPEARQGIAKEKLQEFVLSVIILLKIIGVLFVIFILK
jgi:hypothetical protein